MKLTKGIITKAEAKKISLDYVAFVNGDFDAFGKIINQFDSLKRGQKVITFVNGKFIQAKVTKIDNNSIQAIDGPVVRVSNGEYSWRVDGDRYAFPINNS